MVVKFNGLKTATEYEKIDFTDVELYDENILANVDLSGKVEGTNHIKSEMTYKERAFLSGIIRKTKPKTIVEIGTSAGGSACVILNAIRDIEGAKLYSFDYNTIWYKEVGQDNGRRTGFLVEEIVPELMHKWEIYAGGVPCKYLNEHLPKDGIDVCLIDTAHANPGEHLNILEILPFMKQNGIIVYHDTVFHLIETRYATRTTNCVSINSLNGERILLKSERTKGLPNIGAILLDKNIENMLFALFSNLSLPWHYKIADDDFLEMLAHFLKHYSHDLVQIYFYYYVFFTNGGVNDIKIAKEIAEKQTERFLHELNNVNRLEKDGKTATEFAWVLPGIEKTEHYQKAFEISRQLAEAGDTDAMIRLGRMYRDGKGTNKDIKKAVKWFKHAFDKYQKLAPELVNIFFMSAKTEDRKKAFEICRPLAEAGDSVAMVRLGRMYRHGRGVERDLHNAAEWTRKGIDNGAEWAKNELFDILWQIETPESDAEMIRVINEYANTGDSGAMARLGRAYRDGKGVERDLVKAAEWMKMGADKGIEWAKNELLDILQSIRGHKPQTH